MLTHLEHAAYSKRAEFEEIGEHSEELFSLHSALAPDQALAYLLLRRQPRELRPTVPATR